MQTFMIEQQHFFESTELLHTHEIEKKNTKNYVSSEFVNYLQFITIDMIKNWFQNKQKNEQIHDAIVQFLRCRDFIFFVDQVGSFSDQNSMNSKEFQGHLTFPSGKVYIC